MNSPAPKTVLRGEVDQALVAADGGGESEKCQVAAGIAFLHPLVTAQTRRLPAESPRSCDPHPPRGVTQPARPLRCHLPARQTWKEFPSSVRDAKLDRIEEVLDSFPDRGFAFDEFGPLWIRPTVGSGWVIRKHADRVPTTYHRTHRCVTSTAAIRSATIACGASSAA